MNHPVYIPLIQWINFTYIRLNCANSVIHWLHFINSLSSVGFNSISINYIQFTLVAWIDELMSLNECLLARLVLANRDSCRLAPAFLHSLTVHDCGSHHFTSFDFFHFILRSVNQSISVQWRQGKTYFILFILTVILM